MGHPIPTGTEKKQSVGHSGHKPPYEGQELTIVGFAPKNKNNVVVRDPTGNESLMPLDMVEKGLRLKKLRVN